MPQLNDKARKQSYQVVLATSAGLDMLEDLIIFAQQETDTAIRCGRADVVLRMMREHQRAKEPKTEESE